MHFLMQIRYSHGPYGQAIERLQLFTKYPKIVFLRLDRSNCLFLGWDGFIFKMISGHSIEDD